MKSPLLIITLVLLAVSCSNRPKATVYDTRKGDSGYLFVDIKFPDGSREGINLTVGEELIQRLKFENDSLKDKIQWLMHMHNGDTIFIGNMKGDYINGDKIVNNHK